MGTRTPKEIFKKLCRDRGNLIGKDGCEDAPLPLFRAVPIRNPVILGTKAEKAVRIQLVSILILLFHLSLITLHSALPISVKMLQFLKQYVVYRISYVGEKKSEI